MQYWRETTHDDVEFIAANIRIEDCREVEALGHTPYGALVFGWIESKVCYTLVDPEGVPVAILGVVETEYNKVGSIWLLGTTGIEKFGYRFLRYSKQVLQDLYAKTGHELFFNMTHKDNVVHHKWLKWLGFKFLRRVNIGNSGFIEFARLKG